MATKKFPRREIDAEGVCPECGEEYVNTQSGTRGGCAICPAPDPHGKLVRRFTHAERLFLRKRRREKRFRAKFPEAFRSGGRKHGRLVWRIRDHEEAFVLAGNGHEIANDHDDVRPPCVLALVPRSNGLRLMRFKPIS
jgi:hypothetical protein